MIIQSYNLKPKCDKFVYSAAHIKRLLIRTGIWNGGKWKQELSRITLSFFYAMATSEKQNILANVEFM